MKIKEIIHRFHDADGTGSSIRRLPLSSDDVDGVQMMIVVMTVVTKCSLTC